VSSICHTAMLNTANDRHFLLAAHQTDYFGGLRTDRYWSRTYRRPRLIRLRARPSRLASLPLIFPELEQRTAAVDQEHAAGHVVGGIGAEEGRGAGDLGGGL
jgi:hypothetical protein